MSQNNAFPAAVKECQVEFLFWSINQTASLFNLFAWVFRPTRSIFNLFKDVTTSGERLQILIYTWHSWPLSSEGSLTCHTYCYTGQPFIIVISEDPRHPHCCRAFGGGAVTTSTCFIKFIPNRGSNPDIPHARRMLYH